MNRPDPAPDAAGDREYGFRLPALAGIGLLTFSYVSVLYHVTDVVGGALFFLALVGVVLAFAVATARLLSPRTAALLAVALLAGGFLVYLLSIPRSQRALLFSGRLIADTAALLTGLSVVRLTNAGIWAMAVAPGPVFLSAYLAVRKRYVGSVTVGGVALAFFVLTGDAGGFTALAGVVGATAAVGLGTLEMHGGGAAQLDVLTATLAAMIVVSASLAVFPGSVAEAGAPAGPSPTVESTLVNADDSVAVLGSIRLSPQVRFTVESPETQKWQTATYDRYTGLGWVRTGRTRAYDGRLSGPPGDARTLEQRVTARTPIGTFPAAWRPVLLEGDVAQFAFTTPQGGIRPSGAVEAGTSYTVTSRVPAYTEEALRAAGTDYPQQIEERNLQLPESTPDRVRERTDEVTADADSPYEKAVAIEDYLESEKEYSLNVTRPAGNVADAFLFEMEAGYCTYYATTMVTMLRSEGVPARFVVGYTPGEASGDEYTVRGYDSHAWVQVYFPDVGWVNFDPTPADPRREAEQARLEEAREAGEGDIDGPSTNDTSSGSTVANETSTPISGFPNVNSSVGMNNTTTTPENASLFDDGDDGDTLGLGIPEVPSRQTLVVWTVALAGALAVGRRTGLTGRVAAVARLRYQRRADPTTDVVRAADRLERLFARRHRPRRPGESVRAYVESLVESGADEAALGVVDAYDRARYGDGVSRTEADEAVAVVDRLTREDTPVLRRFVD